MRTGGPRPGLHRVGLEPQTLTQVQTASLPEVCTLLFSLVLLLSSVDS